jgi:hypothetical protein
MGASDFSKLPHIGEALLRKEDYRFLTGAGNYTDDIQTANVSHAVFVRSPYAHANIQSIDTAAASAMRRDRPPARMIPAMSRLMALYAVRRHVGSSAFGRGLLPADDPLAIERVEAGTDDDGGADDHRQVGDITEDAEA